MNIYEYDVLNYIITKGYTNQRFIAESTGYSLGKVNKAVSKLTEEGYLNKQFKLTDKAHQEIKSKRPQRAIILAAGYGMRMVPINTEVPKGLLEVNGETLIERLILQLHTAGIFKIDIVVGFMKDRYEFLIDKYDVRLIYNPQYDSKNNLHSLSLIADQLSNTYILPCDIWSKENPFSNYELYSWYSVTEKIDMESTVRINRQKELLPTSKGKKANTMIGIAYFLDEEAKVLKNNLEKYSADEKYNDFFWEEALFYGENKLTVYARVYHPSNVFEIDTYEQLRELDGKSSHLDTDIISLISKEMGVETRDIQKIVVLKKGMTNRSFRFSVMGKQYIMRIPGEGTDKLINREHEYEVYQTIKKLHISDEVVYMSPKNGYKITEYLHDAREANPDNPEDVKRAIQKLRSFHELKLQVPHSFDIYKEIAFYESLWEGKPSIFRDYQKTKEKVFSLKSIIDSIPKDWVLTHIDAVPDNVLFVGDEIRLIDWEYAGMQDPHLDIAMFAIYSLYNRKQVDDLIAIYFPDGCTDEVRMKIYAYIAIGGLLWSNWCEFKRHKGVEFGEYSLRQYRYAKEYYAIVMKEFINKNS